MNARVKHSNTPESDQQAYVAHIVTLDDGTEREVYATDPLAAIQAVREEMNPRPKRPVLFLNRWEVA